LALGFDSLVRQPLQEAARTSLILKIA
jgi:hypothetical protein